MAKAARPTLAQAAQVKGRTSYSPGAGEAARVAGELPTKRLNVNVPEPMYRKLKARAAIEGRTISEIVLAYVERYAAGE